VSRATQLAQEEADRVEAEEAEEAETAETTPEPETPAEPEEQDAEDAQAAIDKVNALHLDNLHGAIGPDFDAFSPCPCCQGGPAGWVLPFSMFPDEVAASRGAAVYDYFEGRAEIAPQYKVSKTMMMCDACDGEGQVISGAKNQNRIFQCPACSGQGFVPRVDPIVVEPYAFTPNQANLGAGVQVANGPEPVVLDQWGRSMGHPHFGLHPDTIGR